MAPGARRGHPPARGALDKPLLNQEGFDDVLDRAAFLADRGRKAFHTYRAAVEVAQNNREKASVERIEALPVHFEEIERSLGHGFAHQDRKSTRLNSSHVAISYAVFCLKKKTTKNDV